MSPESPLKRALVHRAEHEPFPYDTGSHGPQSIGVHPHALPTSVSRDQGVGGSHVPIGASQVPVPQSMGGPNWPDIVSQT